MRKLPLVWCLAAMVTLTSLPGSLAQVESQPEVEPAKLGTITNVHRFEEIWLAGQPSADDFALARRLGFKTIINLRHDAELPTFNEKEIVELLGLHYFHLPFSGADELTSEIFDQARELLADSEQPTLLHCSSANRVGALWLALRVLDHDLSYEEALAEARMIGLRTPALEEKARAYIESNR